MSQQHYELEFKKKLVHLHLEEGSTLQSPSAQYGVAKSSIAIWCRKFSKECQEQALTNPIATNELEIMKENRRLRAELEETRKENLFLKKAVAFFVKEIDQRLIDLLMKTRTKWESAGFSDALIYIKMLITTT